MFPVSSGAARHTNTSGVLNMSNELSKRRSFAILQTIISLVVPIAYMKALTTFLLFNASSSGFSYLLLGLPVACFLVLALLSLLRRGDKFRVTYFGLWSAAIAGYVCLALPTIIMWIASTIPYRGGGANIGLGLLALGSPIVLPIVISVGLVLGESRDAREKHT